MKWTGWSAVPAAIGAAALFGGVIPVSKSLLDGIGPITLAALLYLGAGLGLLILRMPVLRRHTSEAPITWQDAPALLTIILAGSVAGPILLMVGLSSVPASTASLLLNGELVMTALVAGLFFSEHIGRRTWLAAGCIILGGLLLSYDPTGSFIIAPGAVLILGACLCWGVDNTATRLVSGKEPAMIVIIKGLCAGIVGLIIATLAGESIPPVTSAAPAMIAGFFGYGLSLVLFIRAIRDLGAVRTGSLFACAPFIGVIGSFLILGEVPALSAWISLPLMAVGAWLIVSEQHAHPHHHSCVVHDHRHCHDDEHHTHPHQEQQCVEHAHEHIHAECVHDHDHTPDLHHHHPHDNRQE